MEEHNKATCLFREVNSIKHKIAQQIVAAIELKYLQALRTPGTNQLNHAIPAIFKHLFNILYEDVTSTKLGELTTVIESLPPPPSKSVDTIFAKNDDLVV